MTSHRLPWVHEENALTRALARRQAAALPIVDLTEPNPTRAGFAYEEDRILAALGRPEALQYEPDPRGLGAARQAVAAYYAESHGAIVDPARVLLTASTSEAYALLFKLLCDPGDDVLVPEPSYPLFGLLTSLESVTPRPYALRWDGEWHLDLGTLERAAGPRSRAVLVVSPGNPTGAFLKNEERVAMVRFCASRGMALISDEVFADFPWKPDSRRAPSLAISQGVLAFALSGLSKVAGLPQLKLAWCVAAGPGADAAMSRLELIADTYLSVATPVQWAAPALFATRHGFQRQVRERVATNLGALRSARAADAPWNVLDGEGGWNAILSVPRARSEEEWALAALEAGVLVHPGYFFDFPAGAHLVLSLLPEPERFARAARILGDVLGSSTS